MKSDLIMRTSQQHPNFQLAGIQAVHMDNILTPSSKNMIHAMTMKGLCPITTFSPSQKPKNIKFIFGLSATVGCTIQYCQSRPLGVSRQILLGVTGYQNPTVWENAISGLSPYQFLFQNHKSTISWPRICTIPDMFIVLVVIVTQKLMIQRAVSD